MKNNLSIILLLCCIPCFSQEKELVYGTFRGSQLINSPTIEVVSKKSYDFTIRHRFGMIGPDSSAYQQFLGIDLPANIRFGFAFPITEKITIGLGRTKNGKTVDTDLKYLLLRQTEDNSIPVSAAIYFSAAMMTDKFSKVPEYAFFNDSVTPFEYRFEHRFSYITELIIARKFGENLSMQIVPLLVYKNLVNPGNENQTFVISIGGGYKIGLQSSVIFEYAYRFNNRPAENAYPLSIGWEFGTVGHIFQLVVSTSTELIEQDIYTKKSFNYFKGNFALGFNIRRTSWSKKYKPTVQ